MFLAGRTEGAWIEPVYHESYTNGITSSCVLHFKMKSKMVYKCFWNECWINKLTRSWNEMRWGGTTVSCISHYSTAVSLSLKAFCYQFDAFHVTLHELNNFWHGTYQSLAVMAIHKQPFYISSLLCNWQTPNCCFSSPIKWSAARCDYWARQCHPTWRTSNTTVVAVLSLGTCGWDPSPYFLLFCWPYISV